jgi:hypothetical protein
MKDKVKVEALMNDFIWVLGTLSKLDVVLRMEANGYLKRCAAVEGNTNSPAAATESTKTKAGGTKNDSTAVGKENKKRKLVDIVAESNARKKARTVKA